MKNKGFDPQRANGEHFPGERKLWEANCRRSIQSRKGLRALTALRSALLMMPVRELHPGILVDRRGAVSAIGARMIQKKVDRGVARPEAIRQCLGGNASDVEHAGVALGMPRLVAWSVAVENDRNPEHTPAQRYAQVLQWLNNQLKRRPQPR